MWVKKKWNSHCLESGVTFSMRAMKFSRNSVLLLDSSRSLQYSLRNRRGVLTRRKKLKTNMFMQYLHSACPWQRDTQHKAGMHEALYMRVLKLKFQYAKMDVDQNVKNVVGTVSQSTGISMKEWFLSVCFRSQVAAGGHEGLITKQHMQRGCQSFFHTVAFVVQYPFFQTNNP